ncbi:hypothetical protein [Aquimarina pacifica]|uniref:hypothetical protein n=1 Tax=Aquimarina pacifica TaxID=1296415 RepID=UPI00046FE852|nr:hypothetical protein [Aquimarina pacifica]
METEYRLEYSEAQQWLRMDKGSYTEGTNGFVTIKDNCNDDECHLIECFLYRNEIHGPLTENKRNYTTVDVLRAVNELNDFRKHLNRFNFKITKSK